jgi:hypothetical protein
VPKSKFYEHATISAALREEFVTQVQRITWQYKLAENTIRLRGSDEVPEIQVFALDAKVDDISDNVLAAIDRAVRYPIIFELKRDIDGDAAVRMVAAHKTLTASTSTAPKLSAHFTTDWLPVDTARTPLPPAVDLAGLYTQLLTSLMPITPRPGELVSEVTARLDQARHLERQIAALTKRMRNERQFNRKVELRRALKDQTAALHALTSQGIAPTQETTWTS